VSDREDHKPPTLGGILQQTNLSGSPIPESMIAFAKPRGVPNRVVLRFHPKMHKAIGRLCSLCGMKRRSLIKACIAFACNHEAEFVAEVTGKT